MSNRLKVRAEWLSMACRCGCAALAAAAIAGASPRAARADCTLKASFEGLGVLDPKAQPAGSYAMGVSADGSIIVGTSFFFDGKMTETRGVRWLPSSGIVNLGLPNGGLSASAASRVSNDGLVIVGTMGFVLGGWLEPRNGIFWDFLNQPQPPAILPETYEVTDVSADGLVIVGGTRLPGPWPVMDQAFRRTAREGVVELGLLPGGSYTWAAAVSADGGVIVGFGDTPEHYAAMMWTAQTGVIPIPNFPDVPAQASGISADGTTITGQMESDAFRWTAAEGAVPLGHLNPLSSAQGYDVSGDGSVIVGTDVQSSEEIAFIPTAFIWDAANGMRSLQQIAAESGADVKGWWLQSAMGVSDDGRTIVGNGTNPQGFTEGWVIRLRFAEDVNGDGSVGIDDLLGVINAWGPCAGQCAADIGGDGVVDIDDLLAVIGAWGGCQ